MKELQLDDNLNLEEKKRLIDNLIKELGDIQDFDAK